MRAQWPLDGWHRSGRPGDLDAHRIRRAEHMMVRAPVAAAGTVGAAGHLDGLLGAVVEAGAHAVAAAAAAAGRQGVVQMGAVLQGEWTPSLLQLPLSPAPQHCHYSEGSCHWSVGGPASPAAFARNLVAAQEREGPAGKRVVLQP
eukprot:1156866-Pelagomonas_calceolata.AAC.3